MASLDALEAAQKACDEINELAQQMSCNPSFKAEAVNTFLAMAKNVKETMDIIVTPNYYVGPDKVLRSYADNLENIARNMRKMVADMAKE